MTDQHGIDESGVLRRGKAPVSGVSVPGRIGIGTDLVQSLDYVVMLQLLFNIAEGATPTPPKVWEQLKARGIRSSKNADELVGKNAVYESYTRLIAAGYVRRAELPNVKHPGRKGPIAYDVYDNPAWNPDWQAQQVGSDPFKPSGCHDDAPEEPQVGTLPGTPEASDSEIGKIEETAGQNASPNAGTVVQGSGVPGSGGRRIPAGQNASGVPGSGSASPPTPPPGEVTTPSSPPTGPTGPIGARTQTGEEEAMRSARTPTPAELAAAFDFLSNLPGDWAVGYGKARKYSPLLLSIAWVQGWELGPALAAKLTEYRPGTIYNHAATLGTRIKELTRFRPAAAVAPAPVGSADQPCPQHPFRAAAQCVPCGAGTESPAPATGPIAVDPEIEKAARFALEETKRALSARDGVPASRRPRTPTRTTPAARSAADRARQEEFEARRAEAARALEQLAEQPDPDSAPAAETTGDLR
ncbi:hypothetical protein [Streptomyces sp. H39-C1]|uniref:hypothetical protein n=1 Tax=Streptomyces sp. H39-C1 TaxID=3004355 RepID=UPI0022AEC6BC|nr:hypothetical protein [Streptomyces sp. H39-C1]MCZ4103197.1 hypothetical protein [Streptomyces sp. H39-C1]